jgi:hypothetical protein
VISPPHGMRNDRHLVVHASHRRVADKFLASVSDGPISLAAIDHHACTELHDEPALMVSLAEAASSWRSAPSDCLTASRFGHILAEGIFSH